MKLVIKNKNHTFSIYECMPKDEIIDFRSSIKDEYNIFGYLNINCWDKSETLNHLKANMICQIGSKQLEINEYCNNDYAKKEQKKIIDMYINGKMKDFKYVDLSLPNNGEIKFEIISESINCISYNLEKIPCYKYMGENILTLPKRHLNLLLLEKELYHLLEDEDLKEQLSLFKNPVLIDEFTISDIKYLEQYKIIDIDTMETLAKNSSKILRKSKW